LPIKRFYITSIILFVLIWTVTGCSVHSPEDSQSAASDNTDVERAFATKTSNVQVAGEGIVNRILEDDLSGSRHQRFIVRLASGQTVLIVHNIDIAPRIGSLETGDSVSFYGEYVWNAQGGMVHWTHHDPEGRHVAGWLKHKGQTYQ
jgi:hypothetical protein